MKAGAFFAGLAVIATTLLSVDAVPAKAQDKKPYTIYLSNNFVGNDWRQQMLRSADIAVKKPPLAGRVDLKVEVVETTVQAQINSLNNIIRNKPDAIVIDAGSGEALNPTIEKACKADIVVIAFDQIVSAPCAYTMESDWGRAPRVEAEWLVKKLGGKGKILVDRGLAGAPISAQLQGGFEEVIKKYPGIEVVGYFNGDYALGPEQAGVASLLAAHPQVDAIFVQGYGAGAIKALQDAGPNPTREKVLAALKTQDFDSGVMAGRMQFGPEQRAANRSTIFIKYDGNTMTTLPGVFTSRWTYQAK